MAITEDAIITFRPYAGFTDRGLPMGIWAVIGLVTGDATGGNRTLNIQFSIQGTTGGGNLYSLEQMTLNDTNNASKDADVRSVNMDGVGGGSPWENGWVYGLQTGGISRAMREVFTTTPLPYFLGIPRKGSSGSLQVAVNNADTAILRCEAQGYWWSPRSLGVDGGPRRPNQGFFPA